MTNLPVDKQFNILAQIWGRRPDDRGYVFFAWIPGHLKTRKERIARGVWKQASFHWPQDREKIEECLSNHEDDDLYFTPSLFDQPQRTSAALSMQQRVLYADLDEIDPREIESDYKPTIAWQTSDARYQAVWNLATPDYGLSDEGGHNQRLTAYLGADPTGWDCTQLLRVPGRVNHKPGKKGQQGVVLWTRGNLYDSSDDFDDLPEIEIDEVEPLSEEDEDIDRTDVWSRVRMRVSSRIREYMGIRDQGVADEATAGHTEGASGLMWEVERELADAGCTAPEIVAIIQPMLWNKFAGRHDEISRLRIEAAKAIARSNRKEVEEDSALEEIEDIDFSTLGMDEFLNLSKPRPSWLVKDIWSQYSVGFIAGAPKSYKSWFGLDLAISIATGTPFLGVYEVARQGRVLYIQEEDSDIEVDDRARKIYRGKPPEIHPQGFLTTDNGQVWWNPREINTLMQLSVRKGLDLTDPTWQGLLDQKCEEGDYDMVIIDTLGTTIGDADTDKGREVNQALKPLKIIAATHRCAIAVVHHFSKAGSDKGRESRGGRKMLGSVALHAWAECGLYVGEKTEVRAGVYQVPVEREAKRAEDLRFRVDVPRMGTGVINEDGEMVGNLGWAPIVHEGEGTIDKSGKGDGNGEGEDVEGGQKSRRNSKPAGFQIAYKLRGAAASNEKRALAVKDIRERLFGGEVSSSAVSQQLKKACENGFVTKTEDGRYYALSVSK